MASVDRDPAALKMEVRRVADATAVELGFDPEDCVPELLQKLRPDDHLFLDDQGIDEQHSLWAVYYGPPAINVKEDMAYAVAGGDLTVYVDITSLEVVAVWQGE
jgi:hypothetical protein